MIGSKRKSRLIRKQLVEEQLASEEEIARMVSPVGLDIGAESPNEIAISIVSQLVSWRRQRKLNVASSKIS